IQEWWGLNDHVKDICDRFAAEGFAAFAPDIYQGKLATSPDEAGKLMMALNIGEAEKILNGAIQTLLSNPSCTSKSVGVVGFCMGGQLAMYAAATNPDQVSASVNFYGIHPNVKPPYARMKAAVLGLFAENDSSVDAEAVEKLRKELSGAGKSFEFHTYKNVGHAFFNNTRPVYDQESARDAWRRTLEFLRRHVK
ncbi:dienelactone hydrolase family protein, partial [bacterium]|nr:dienelactone hydrolase family protein [bacterium]